MVIVERRVRRGRVLTPSAIPCLRSLPTVNVTVGCSHGCGYCYIQGYSNYPGEDRVVLFTNTAALIRGELGRRRVRPERVYFSPSSDAFQYQPEVRAVTLESMRVLLEAGVGVAFLTKGYLSSEFFELFAAHRGKVFPQIGITTLDTKLSRLIEPRAAPPGMRLEAVRRLMEVGIAVRPRLDPLLPDVTDLASNLDPLFEALGAMGVCRVSASFLFVRSAFAGTVRTQYAELGVGFGPGRWEVRSFDENCGSAKSLKLSERTSRLAKVSEVAARHGIGVEVCTCKNPDIAGVGCCIAGRPRGEGAGEGKAAIGREAGRNEEWPTELW